MDTTEFPPLNLDMRKSNTGNPPFRQIMAVIRTAFDGGRLSPREAIPSVASLARHLTISNQTVSRAYKGLEFLERTGEGWRVKDYSQWAAIMLVPGTGLVATPHFPSEEAADAWGRATETPNAKFAHAVRMVTADEFGALR